MFQLTEPLQIHIAVLLPAIVLGIVGGFLGAFFARCNAFIVKTRKKLLAYIHNQYLAGSVRILEVVIMAVSMVVVCYIRCNLIDDMSY